MKFLLSIFFSLSLCICSIGFPVRRTYRSISKLYYSDTVPIVYSFYSCINPDLSRIFTSAANKAIDGGVAGASASAVQVISLMWLRTAMNYQYQYGNSTLNALKSLYNKGGIPRLYQGLSFAIVQGPLSRFGDTATNALVLSVLESLDEASSIPLPVRTAIGSVAAGLWRIFLMPIDTFKTSLQVNGKEGFEALTRKVDENGIQTLYAGSIASAAATIVGHFPWFFVYNSLSVSLPAVTVWVATVSEGSGSDSNSLILFLAHIDPKLLDLARSAFIGLCASSTSDICSNSLRVLKTYRQTSSVDISYAEVARKVLSEDGWTGLLGRGLQTRLLSNALQGMMFSVLWKYFQKLYSSS